MTSPSPWSENVERVREALGIGEGNAWAWDGWTGSHAALAALTAQMKELERERDGYRFQYEHWGERAEAAEKRAEALESVVIAAKRRADTAEALVERYERMLGQIAQMKDYGAAMVAVEALSKTPESTPQDA